MGESVIWDWIVFLGMCLSCYAIHHITLSIFKYNRIELSKTKRVLLGWLVVLSVFVPAFIYDENDRIKDGEKYYVNLFPEEDSQKNYRVPGLVFVDEGGFSLFEVFWSNGGTTTFENHSHDSKLIIGEKVFIEDDEGEDWYVELTKVKADLK